MGVLTVAGMSQLEQRILGNNIRTREVYSAAVGALEYGISWLEQGSTSLDWSDDDNDGVSESGDTAIKELTTVSLSVDSYSRRLTFTLRTDANPTIDSMPRVIELAATASAQADSHVVKTVFTTVLIGGTKRATSHPEDDLEIAEIPGSWRDF